MKIFLVLLCLFKGFSHIGATLPIQSFGNTSTVFSLPQGNNISSGPINVTGGIPYLGNLRASTLYISDNGIVTLNDEFLDPPLDNNMSYPFRAIAGLGILMIAPYWSDNDIRLNGSVRYAIYESSNPDPTVATRISSVAAIVINVTAEPFNADWMLLVEWRDVSPFPAGSGNPLVAPYTPAYVASTNLYQLLLITDRIAQAYAFFIYECNTITWSGIDFNARVGISDGSNAEFNHPVSNMASVIDVDCNYSRNVIQDLDFGALPHSTAVVIAQASMTATQANPVVTSTVSAAQTSAAQASLVMTQAAQVLTSSAISPTQTSAALAQATVTTNQANVAVTTSAVSPAQTTGVAPQASMAATQATVVMTSGVASPAQTTSFAAQTSMAGTQGVSNQASSTVTQTSVAVSQVLTSVSQSSDVASAMTVTPSATMASNANNLNTPPHVIAVPTVVSVLSLIGGLVGLILLLLLYRKKKASKKVKPQDSVQLITMSIEYMS